MSFFERQFLPYNCFVWISILLICCILVCRKEEPYVRANHEHNDHDGDGDGDGEGEGVENAEEHLDIDDFSLESVDPRSILYRADDGRDTHNTPSEQHLRALRGLKLKRKKLHKIRRNRVLESIIIKKVIQSRDRSPITPSYRSYFINDHDTHDLENQIPSPDQQEQQEQQQQNKPEQESEQEPQPSSPSEIQQCVDDNNDPSHCNRPGCIFHSFASALVKSNKSVAFSSSSSSEHNHDTHDNQNGNPNPNDDKSTSNNTNTPTPTPTSKPKTHRRKSNLIARKIALSLQTFGTESEPVGCNICLMEFQMGEFVAWSNNPNCIHGFHKECIVDWLLVKNECPVCRRDYLFRNRNRT